MGIVPGVARGSRATCKDKAVLLRIADAWDEQAQVAGQASAKKADGGSRSEFANIEVTIVKHAVLRATRPHPPSSMPC
jgi:hypothetical protein